MIIREECFGFVTLPRPLPPSPSPPPRRVDSTHPFGLLRDEDMEEVSLELLCLLDSYLSARDAETHQ